MQRVGIYSGAFDPVHNAHVQFAVDAARVGRLDKVFFMVEPRPRHKQGVKAMEHRVAMVKLAIADHPKLGVIVLDQQRFTVHDTWPKLQARFMGAEMVMIMGNDVFKHLSHWPQLDVLAGSVTFLVGLRGGAKAEFLHHLGVVERARHVQVRHHVFASNLPTVASRTIRAQLRAGTVPDVLDARVAGYIAQHQLYTTVQPEE